MIKQTYKPIEPVNIGVNKDTINDFARKYNLEIERVYDILNKYKQRKVAFTAKGDYWNVTDTGATLSVAHNGNIIYAVFSVADGVETQVVVGVKRDDTNVILEAEAPFDGYMLFLSDDSTRGVGDNLPEDVIEEAKGVKEAAVRAETAVAELPSNWQDTVANALISKTKTDGFVTPQMFGAVGDGVTNDYVALSNMYQSIKDSGLMVLFPKGIYLVNERLDITVPTIMSERAYIKATSNLEYVCVLREHNLDDTVNPMWHFNTEYRINVDGDNKAQKGVGIGYCRQAHIYIQARNCTSQGVNCGFVKSGNNENLINVYATNCPIGVYIEGADNVYGEIVTIDCPTGVFINGEDVHINTIHSWLTSTTNYANSVVLNGFTNSRVSVNWLCQDSMQYATKMEYSCNVRINHLFSVFGGDSIYDTTRPQLFYYNRNNVSVLSIGTLTIQKAGQRVTGTIPFDNYNKYVALKIDNLLDLYFTNMDKLPTQGNFKVTGQTTPISGTALVSCTEYGGSYFQTINVSTGIVYKRSKNYWDDNWGAWYKYQGTIVS